MKFIDYTILGGLTPNTPIYGDCRKKCIPPLNLLEKITSDRHIYIFYIFYYFLYIDTAMNMFIDITNYHSSAVIKCSSFVSSHESINI